MPVLICLREKLWTRTYSIGDQVPTCPVFTRAKIKSRFGILVNLPSQKQGQTQKRHSLMDAYTWRWLLMKMPMLANQQRLQLSADIGCCLEDLPGATDSSAGFSASAKLELNKKISKTLSAGVWIRWLYPLQKGKKPPPKQRLPLLKNWTLSDSKASAHNHYFQILFIPEC